MRIIVQCNLGGPSDKDFEDGDDEEINDFDGFGVAAKRYVEMYNNRVVHFPEEREVWTRSDGGSVYKHIVSLELVPEYTAKMVKEK